PTNGAEARGAARVSVQALAALVFASATATQLAGARMITGADAALLEVLDAIFAPVGRTGFLSHF
ncbi:MAG: sterol carrier protein domain-containing protein, partial [Propionibacterium sp.]|nr:sterol carrier protein domain-containing protein [Propionibacterium sp.]